MSMLNFDASRVAPATGELEPIPAGWYDVVMDQSEMKPTKDGATTGNAYLECRFNVASGQYAGRKLYSRLNLRNSNPVASEIAQKELSAICHAVGIMQVQDSQQFHGIPLKVKVKLRAADGNYSASNEVTTYKPINFVPDGPVAGAVPAGAVPPAMGGVQPPQMAQQPWAAPGAAQPPQQWQQPPAQAAQPPAQPQPWQQPAQAPQQPMQPPQQPQWQQPQQQAPVQQPPMPPQQQPAQPPAQQWAPEANAGGMQPPPWARPAG